MSRADWCWLISAIMVFIVISAWTFIALHYRTLRKRDQIRSEPIVSPEVHAASHNLSNEATKLRAVTKRISESDDPIGALVSAMTGQRYERHH